MVSLLALVGWQGANGFTTPGRRGLITRHKKDILTGLALCKPGTRLHARKTPTRLSATKKKLEINNSTPEEERSFLETKLSDSSAEWSATSRANTVLLCAWWTEGPGGDGVFGLMDDSSWNFGIATDMEDIVDWHNARANSIQDTSATFVDFARRSGGEILDRIRKRCFDLSVTKIREAPEQVQRETYDEVRELGRLPPGDRWFLDAGPQWESRGEGPPPQPPRTGGNYRPVLRRRSGSEEASDAEVFELLLETFSKQFPGTTPGDALGKGGDAGMAAQVLRKVEQHLKQVHGECPEVQWGTVSRRGVEEGGLPPGWTQHRSEEDGTVYYHKKEKNISVWKRPTRP